MKKSIKISIVLFLVVSSIALGFNSARNQIISKTNLNDDTHQEIRSPKTAQSLSSSDVWKSTDEVYRLFETINISVNVSKFTNADRVDIKFTYQDSTEDKFLELDNYTNYIYNYSFTPFDDTPIGLTFISFIIRDGLTTIKEEDNIANFTVKSNYVVDLNKKDLYRGEVLHGELLVTNISDTYFDWNVTVAYSTSAIDDTNFEVGFNVDSFGFTINNSFTSTDPEFPNYWIKLQMLNRSNTNINGSAFYKFQILTENNLPEINATSIVFTPDPLYRTKQCNLTFDADDADISDTNLQVSIEIEGPNLETLSFDNAEITHHSDGTFSKNFTIPANYSVGPYEVVITVNDNAGGSDTEIVYLDVINNPPKILDFKINDKEINESITINYGEQMRFTFNVSDKEGIDYMTVALFNEENNWFNITQSYQENMNLTIRTVDLAEGTWNIYVYVTDTNGETSGLSEDYNIAPKQIKIVRRSIEGVLPWLMLIMGLVFGALITIGFASTWIKTRTGKKGPRKLEEKEKAPRKAKKKPKKEQIAKSEEKPSGKEEEEKEEKEEKKTTKRKIKRKL